MAFSMTMLAIYGSVLQNNDNIFIQKIYVFKTLSVPPLCSPIKCYLESEVCILKQYGDEASKRLDTINGTDE